MVVDEIRLFLGRYFEVLQTQELSLFDAVFHETCVLYSHQGGELTVRSFQSYRDLIQGRESAASSGHPRDEQILMLDVHSPTMAVVKVRLRIFDSIVEDYLNLMKHEGRWLVFAKHINRIGAA